MYCPIGNHRDLGMSGEVTVRLVAETAATDG